MIPHSTAYVFLVVNMAVWGGSLVVARGVHEIAPPMALTFWRWVVAVLVLLPFVARRLYQELPLKPEARRFVYGICGYMAAGSTLSVVAVNYTTALNATVINGIQPAVTAVVALILLRERLSLVQTLGIVFAFLGILVMIFQASLMALIQMSINTGDLVMLGAVICWSFYAVELHRGTHLPSPEVLLFLIACTGVVFGLPLYLFEATYIRVLEPTVASLSAIAYLGVGATVLAVYLWNVSIRSVGANRAAVFLNLIPVFGISLAITFLGERFFSYHIVGACLVVTGIYFAVRRGASGSAPVAAVEEKL